jgi:hypothetical protein
MPTTLQDRKRIILLGLMALLWIYMIYAVSSGENQQWDFKTYYYAAKADGMGLDPYDTGVLSNVSQSPITLPYVYPPLTLGFFKVLTLFSYDTAVQLWLFLKVILLGGLLFIWRKHFLTHDSDFLIYLFCTVAYASAIYWDFVSGNICIIEQFLVWLGLYFLKEKKLLPFTALIVAVSLFKLTFIVFLLLPFLLTSKNRVKYLVSGAGVFLAALGVDYLAHQGSFSKYLSIALSVDERGAFYNPSVLALIKDFLDFCSTAGYFSKPGAIISYLIYAVAVATVLWITYKAVRTGGIELSGKNSKLLIFLFCLVYALVMPRFKSYSYILLLPASYFVIKECVKPQAFIYLFILLALTKWTPLPFPDVVKFLWWYYPLLTAAMVWLLLILFLREGAHSAIATSASIKAKPVG